MKYYGDLWLKMRDVFEGMSIEQGVIFETNSRLGLINPRELAYLNGEKELLMANAGYFIGIQRMIKLDVDKYLPIIQKSQERLNKDIEPLTEKTNNLYT